MVYRSRPRFTTALSSLLVTTAFLLVVGSAAAQPPPPEGSPPPAAGHPETTPPPATGQPSTAPPPAAGQPGGAPPPPGGAAPAPAPAGPRGPLRALEHQLRIGIGGEFFVFLDQLIGNGPAVMFSSHWIRWWGPFMLGGGPSIHYSYLIESREPKDTIHQMTLNGDVVIGGGIYGKFAIYAHLLLGAGVASAYDGETDTKLTTFWVRAVAGIGAYYQFTRLLSAGVIVDVGWPGTVEILATVGFHFGRRR